MIGPPPYIDNDMMGTPQTIEPAACRAVVSSHYAERYLLFALGHGEIGASLFVNRL